MAYDAIICDWNGTITKDHDERPILESIAVDLFKASVPCHPFRIARILRAKRELEALYREGRRDTEFNFVTKMFRIYNERIINGLPMSFIHRSVEEYANKQQTRDKLEYRILRLIDGHHRAGKVTGILSAGYRHGIQIILKTAGYDGCFDFYEANLLKEERGRAIGFELNVYKNKLQLLLKLLRGENIDERRVVFFGDSDDDACCFEVVGYPVVAFLASEELKEKYAEKYKAFVPKDEKDLVKYLQGV